MRRVVVGNVGGRSQVISDGPPPRSAQSVHTPGFSNTLLWSTPADPHTREATDVTTLAKSFIPGPAGTSLLWLTLPPASVFQDPHRDHAAAEAEHGLISPGIHGLMERDVPGMHTTPTIDYDLLVDGALTLELDDGEVDLQAGDVVIQHGTRHAWRNRSATTATLFIVFLGAHTT